MDVSQAFLQSGDIHLKGRAMRIPSPMIPFPWEKSVYKPETDVEKIANPQMGFLILRPLYGSREGPRRRFLRLSQIIAGSGMRQLRTYVCFFTWRNRHVLEGLLLEHVDGMVVTGRNVFRATVITAPNRLRAGALGTMYVEKETILPVYKLSCWRMELWRYHENNI